MKRAAPHGVMRTAVGATYAMLSAMVDREMMAVKAVWGRGGGEGGVGKGRRSGGGHQRPGRGKACGRV